MSQENSGIVINNGCVMVKTNCGTMPIEDYREIKAHQYGFDSYNDMRIMGYKLGDGVDID